MEGTVYQLRVEKAEDYDKTYEYDLQFLDEAVFSKKAAYELPISSGLKLKNNY